MESFRFLLFVILFSLISFAISQESTDFTETYATEEIEPETTAKTITEMSKEQTDMVKKIVTEKTEATAQGSEIDKKNDKTQQNLEHSQNTQIDESELIRKIISQMENAQKPEADLNESEIIKKIIAQMGNAQKPDVNLNQSEMIKKILAQMEHEDKPLSFSEKEKQFIEELKLKCKFFGLSNVNDKSSTQQIDTQDVQQFWNHHPTNAQDIQQFWNNPNHLQTLQIPHLQYNHQPIFPNNPPKNIVPSFHTNSPKKTEIVQEQPLKNQNAQFNPYHLGQNPTKNFNKPYYVQQNPANNYFYWYPQNTIRTNKLAETTSGSEASKNKTTFENHDPHHNQIGFNQHLMENHSDEPTTTDDFIKMNFTQNGKLKYVKLEPLILQKTLLTNGQTLLQWYRLIPGTQSFIQIPDIPENANVDTIAQPQTHPQQTLPLPDEYLYYVDPHTGAIIKNMKLHGATVTTTPTPIAPTDVAPGKVIKGRIQYFINPLNGMIYPPSIVAMNQKNQANFLQNYQNSLGTNLLQHHQSHHNNIVSHQHQGMFNQLHGASNVNQASLNVNQQEHEDLNHKDIINQNRDSNQNNKDTPNQHGDSHQNHHDILNQHHEGNQNHHDILNQHHEGNQNHHDISHQNQQATDKVNLIKNNQNQDKLNQNHDNTQQFQPNQDNLIQDHFFHHHPMNQINVVPNHGYLNDASLMQDQLYHHNNQNAQIAANHGHRVTYGYWPQMIPQPQTPIPFMTTEIPTTTERVETTTTQAPKTSIQYTIDYSQYDKFQEKYKNQYRFVLPMVVGGNNQDFSKFPVDPYAYLPKDQRPDYWKISVPYVPNYHMIKAIAVPKKYTETSEDLENVNLK